MNHDTDMEKHRGFVRYAPDAARILMGLIFATTGLNGFLNFLPQPKTPMPEKVVAFMGALLQTGYLLPLIMGTQLIAGALLLMNRFVPLALAILAPIIVGIITFHVFLLPSGLPLALAVLVLEIYLAWMYRKAYRAMLAMRTKPGKP